MFTQTIITPYTQLTPEPTSAVCCNHANEVPAQCVCATNCYCKAEGSCAPHRTASMEEARKSVKEYLAKVREKQIQHEKLNWLYQNTPDFSLFGFGFTTSPY